MIVKIHSRGAGSGSGPVDYLLGKDRQREQATVLRGDPDRVWGPFGKRTMLYGKPVF